jgi:ribonuclease G
VSYELIINSTPDGVITALLDENKLIELHKDGLDNNFSVGDVYLGKVKKSSQV